RQACRTARVHRWPNHGRRVARWVRFPVCCGSCVLGVDFATRMARTSGPAKISLGERQWISSITNEFDSLRERVCSGRARNENNCDGQNAPRGGVHHFLPPGPVTHHRPSSVRFLVAVNRKLPWERLNLDPGLKGKTKSGEQNHLKRFWKNSQLGIKS